MTDKAEWLIEAARNSGRLMADPDWDVWLIHLRYPMRKAFDEGLALGFTAEELITAGVIERRMAEDLVKRRREVKPGITYTMVHPDADGGMLDRDIEDEIAWKGLHVLVLDKDGSTEEFQAECGGGVVAYTVGNFGHDGLPELITIAPDPETACETLEALSTVLRGRGRAFGNGEIVSLGRSYKIVGPVAGVGFSLLYAAGYWGSRGFTTAQGAYGEPIIPAQQVLVSDDAGRFTDDPACALRYPGVHRLIGTEEDVASGRGTATHVSAMMERVIAEHGKDGAA